MQQNTYVTRFILILFLTYFHILSVCADES